MHLREWDGGVWVSRKSGVGFKVHMIVMHCLHIEKLSKNKLKVILLKRRKGPVGGGTCPKSQHSEAKAGKS